MDKNNAILIQFEDGFENASIKTTPYFRDMIGALGDSGNEIEFAEMLGDKVMVIEIKMMSKIDYEVQEALEK